MDTAEELIRRGGEGTGFSSEIETSNVCFIQPLQTLVARELASHLRLKLISCLAMKSCTARGEGTGFSSEIETCHNYTSRATPYTVARELASHLRLKLCLFNPSNSGKTHVARELASHLRLKHHVSARPETPCRSGEGTGFSSEIETVTALGVRSKFATVARELASHLRLKLLSGSRAAHRHTSGEGTGFSSEIETLKYFIL